MSPRSPGPDQLHTSAIPPRAARKRRRVPQPSIARVVLELIVVSVALFAVVIFVPLASRWFVIVTAVACVFATGYAIYGAIRIRGAAKWWGFVWGGKYDDDLARGLFHTGLLFILALVPIAVIKCGIRTPTVTNPLAYLLWCFAQDFLFFSILFRGIERLTPKWVVGSQHLPVGVTALLFGLSHFPFYGFMIATAGIAVFWGYIFQRSRLLWPVTALHFLLGLIVMA